LRGIHTLIRQEQQQAVDIARDSALRQGELPRIRVINFSPALECYINLFCPRQFINGDYLDIKDGVESIEEESLESVFYIREIEEESPESVFYIREIEEESLESVFYVREIEEESPEPVFY